MPTFKLNKIVKDLLVKKSEDLGIKVEYIRLEGEEAILALFTKFNEELKELQWEKEPDKRLKELVDIQMIVNELLNLLQISKEDFQKIIDQQTNEKWSFSQKLYVHTMKMSEDNQRCEYYRKDPEKYPEIWE